MDLDSRKEIVFFYESIRANPNGDPGFDNHPRMYPDNTVMVTDVRIKRTIRDYAKKASEGKDVIFVDYGNDGEPVEADKRAKEILVDHDKWPSDEKFTRKNKGKIISGLLRKTFDVPLFGALVTIRDNEDSKGKKSNSDQDDEGSEGKKPGSAQITGTCQFGMGKSVNEADVITVQIAGRFVGDRAKGRETTLGTYSVIDYALIKTVATINPANLELSKMENRLGDDAESKSAIKEIEANFVDAESKLLKYLWAGTNDLITRSKFQQRSVLVIEVEYDKSYSDLDTLIDVKDTKSPKEHATELADIEFGFKRLITALGNRVEHVKGIRVACDPRLDDVVKAAVDSMPKSADNNKAIAKKVDLSR